MAIEVDTFVERIDITQEADLGKAIKDICDNQAARDKPRRLAAAFEAQNQVILIFRLSSRICG
jgi:hypothetical protein